MANSQTYLQGLGQSQVTSLSNIQGAGLTLPTLTSNFIDTRSPGKLEVLFNTSNNSNVLYTTNKPTNLYLKGPLAERLDYIDINTGQVNIIKTTSQSAIKDGQFITKFLGTNAGIKFILRQLYGQGFQPFDETKIYNPASPILAAYRLATLSLLERPVRHLDTSNIVGGLIGAAGLGTIVRTVGGLFGGGSPPLPSPPRSSVASEASRGGLFSVATFTSLLGGGDRSDKVVSPLARPDVKGLLRGQTATNAYNSQRYIKLVNNGTTAKNGFFTRLLTGVGRYLQNNTLLGGILPPKQPWPAEYRADEQTYDYYLNSGKLFDPNYTGVNSGGILGGVLNAIGFGKKADYSLAVTQRFYGKSKNKPNFNRSINVSRLDNYLISSTLTNKIGVKTLDKSSEIGVADISSGQQQQSSLLNILKSTVGLSTDDTSKLKYTDVVGVTQDGNSEQSDQLFNYAILKEDPKKYSDTFTDPQNQKVKDIAENFSKAIVNILGQEDKKYKPVSDSGEVDYILPQQFSTLNYSSKNFVNDKIGFNYLKENTSPSKYIDRFFDNKGQPTRNGKSETERFIEPTNNVDYVNSLGVLTDKEFDQKYRNIKENKFGGKYGPDIIKFYFYDIVNKKYIPFAATVKDINDINNAQWEEIDYLGRADKQFYYKNFTRELSFNFTVNAHSIKELLPMWQRINYLTSLTKPSNYTQGQFGGFMIPPMVELNLGDFYKKHFVIIRSCNVTIPEDCSWETLSEDITENWYWGPNKTFEWMDSKDKHAQFPRTANISLTMNVLEKDRPKAGRAMWGDAFVIQADVVSSNLEKTQKENLINEGIYTIDYLDDNDFRKDFSIGIRYDTDISSLSRNDLRKTVGNASAQNSAAQNSVGQNVNGQNSTTQQSLNFNLSTP